MSPAEKALYVTYSNGAGPYDGTDGKYVVLEYHHYRTNTLVGSVYKYDITSGTWTDITPVSGSDLYFGFGGLAVDLQNPGTIIAAALNSWWPGL